MKHLYLPALMTAALISAPACSAETPQTADATATPTPAETSKASSSSKFNFSVPGDNGAATGGSTGSYNFAIPDESGDTPTSGGLGNVELPDDGAEELPEYKPSLTVPAED